MAREDDEGGQKSPREGIHGKARGGWPGRSELRVGGVMDVPWSVICIVCPFLRASVSGFSRAENVMNLMIHCLGNVI